jgi:hypothetical protein
VGQTIHQRGLDLRLVAVRWRPVAAAEADERVMVAKATALAAASLGCRDADPAAAASAVDELQQMKDCRMLVSLATVARASSDGPDAPPRVEAKVREIVILLDHCESASRAGEGETVPNRATVRAEGGDRG